jgi:hypothetical protein
MTVTFWRFCDGDDQDQGWRGDLPATEAAIINADLLAFIKA